MKFVELLQLIQDETKSEEYLRSNGILKTFTNCPRCNGTDPRLARGDRWKCYKCKTEWTRRKDSILSLVRISYSEFLLCLKSFELELTVDRCAKEYNIHLKAVDLLYTEFRKSISNISNDNNIFSKIIKGQACMLSIFMDDGKVFLDITENDTVNKKAIIKITRSRIQNSAAIYEFEFSKLRKKLNHIGDKDFSRLGIFWRFVKPRLINFKGTDLMTLFLYLKELEFRFNNSKEELFSVIVTKLGHK